MWSVIWVIKYYYNHYIIFKIVPSLSSFEGMDGAQFQSKDCDTVHSRSGFDLVWSGGGGGGVTQQNSCSLCCTLYMFHAVFFFFKNHKPCTFIHFIYSIISLSKCLGGIQPLGRGS